VQSAKCQVQCAHRGFGSTGVIGLGNYCAPHKMKLMLRNQIYIGFLLFAFAPAYAAPSILDVYRVLTPLELKNQVIILYKKNKKNKKTLQYNS
jgi:hypothetical protein